MRDLFRSMVRLSVAAPMLAAKQAVEMWSRTGRASLVGELDSITGALQRQMDGPSRDLYDSGESVGHRVLDGVQGRTGAGSAPAPGTGASGDDVRPGDLDVRTVVVLGEGLAAGFGDFALAEESQRESFPAHLAAHMGTELSQPGIESPGLGQAPGFPALPVTVPALMQTTALEGFPAAEAPRNLSVPGFRVADAVGLRPVPPVVRQDDVRQTLANLVLGGADLVAGAPEALPTQLERAVAQEPGLAILELGYYEALEAAVAGDPSRLPEVAAFESDYAKLLAGLRGCGAAVLAMTIPDPLDTAYYSSLESAAANLRMEPSALAESWSLSDGDRVSVPALLEMGYQMLAGSPGDLPPGGVLPAAVAEELRRGVAALNDAIRKLAAAQGAEVFELDALIRRVAAEGLEVGPRSLDAEFLGGFYQLNGYYPGATGQALIADELVVQLNRAHGSSFRRVDLEAVVRRDPAAGQQRAGGPVSSPGEKRQGAHSGVTEVAHRRDEGSRSKAGRGKPAAERKGPSDASPLQLPPGLEQTLPLSKAASYFGDAIRAAHCRLEDEQTFGSGRELLFGGLAMVDSHLEGQVRIRFSEPKDGTSRFEVFHGRLEGDDGTLQAPQFFKLPALRNEVRDDDELVSTGVLNLASGEVSELAYAVRFFNTALMALVRVNPQLPDVPIQFPGLYGSASARFEQRDDGLLDFTFYGTTFIPLGGAIEGDPVRFPLPLSGPTLEFASIPAPGTALHPHLHITTKEPEQVPAEQVPEIPVNTVREYTLFTRASSFGDKFTLHAEELAGDPTGRSHLLGRVQVQFGAPSGDSVPVAVSCLNPGGMLAEPAPSPLADMFPGRLPASPTGHNEFLRFATRSYYLDALTCIDDPFDVSVGNVSRSSGLFLADLLHRALIGQNLFYALLRVEPRTPKSSFHFRGPARFDKGQDGRAVLRFYGQVNIPYPEGFLFPSPDMATGVRIGPGSELDPFYWIRAVEHDRSTDAAMSGGASDVVSSSGERFSYEYDIRGDQAEGASRFEYTNDSVGGVFRLETLSWVSFVNSQEPGSTRDDTVSFAGFGTWSRDESGRKHLVCAQICEAEDARYVSIQVDGGRTSNVNTRPGNLEDVRP